MKVKITAIIIVLLGCIGFAQQGINYKAILKDTNGNVLANTLMTVQFSIHQSTNNGTIVYQEDHVITTDSNGLVLLNIGTDTTPLSGTFATIDWSANQHFLQTSIGYSGGNIFFDATEFMAVPYAKHAERATVADNVTTKINDLTDGKSETNGSSLFIGIDAGRIDNGNNENVGIGFNALYSNSAGSSNTAVGSETLYSNISGQNNTAMGREALKSNLTPSGNTAIGASALRDNETGAINTGLGLTALGNNTTGASNTATGGFAMRDNTVGSNNTANGRSALFSNITGNNNNAIGHSTLYSNTDGDNNTANGHLALNRNTTGNGNLANSYRALYNNINGNFNVGIGVETLFLNTSGDNNTALGYGALTGITTGNNNIGIGFDAEVPSGTGSNQVKIGNSAISYAGIQVDWSITSDKRWKNNIRELPYGLDIVMQLQPVDYTRKNNPNKTREMGFIAQDLEVLLEKVGYTDQGFLTKDDDGYLSVRYNDLIALLTKALQEQQLIIEAQNSKDVVQDKFIKEQGKSIEDLVARLNLIESKSTN